MLIYVETLLAGSRRISCRELGQGDHQGWLYRRRDNKGFLLPHRWERRWFILKVRSVAFYLTPLYFS